MSGSYNYIRIRIRIKLYFTLVLKTINIRFKLSVNNGNEKKIKKTTTYSNKIHQVRKQFDMKMMNKSNLIYH